MFVFKLLNHYELVFIFVSVITILDVVLLILLELIKN